MCENLLKKLLKLYKYKKEDYYYIKDMLVKMIRQVLKIEDFLEFLNMELQGLNNNTRLWGNCGYTPAQLIRLDFSNSGIKH